MFGCSFTSHPEVFFSCDALQSSSSSGLLSSTSQRSHIPNISPQIEQNRGGSRAASITAAHETVLEQHLAGGQVDNGEGLAPNSWPNRRTPAPGPRTMGHARFRPRRARRGVGVARWCAGEAGRKPSARVPHLGKARRAWVGHWRRITSLAPFSSMHPAHVDGA